MDRPSRGIARVLAIALFALATGGSSAAPQGGGGPGRERAPAARFPLLSVRQLTGQRIVYAYRGVQPPPWLLGRVAAGEAGGVIFFADNVASRTQIRRVAARLQRAALRSPVAIPLLLMTDQEGGAVRRLPGAPVPSEREIGRSVRRLDAARRAGRDAGRNLARAGLGVNLAPVLDVSRSPAGFIARDGRSYGRGPNTVGRLASAFIGAQQAVGVAATAKHFPGLGAAGPSEDTDRRPVTLRVPAPTLRAVDELPYRRAIAGSVRLVMVSWAVYPALDPARPAGLSPAVVEGELRGRLGFTGVTITDALAAGALRESGDASARAVAAAGAGMDLLLCASGDAGEGAMAAGGLATALRDGRLDPGTARDAVSRILALRRDLPG